MAMTACPGCGVVLAPSTWPVDGRANASPACLELRAQVMEFEAAHLIELGRLHQLTIDAYGAQHGGANVPAIAVPFGLIGLHLALDDGWSGSEVRDAHQFLAQTTAPVGRRGAPTGRSWPTFSRPSRAEWLTVADVAGVRTAAEHAERVERWARSVWRAWAGEHDRVRTWAAAALTADVRGRILGR